MGQISGKKLLKYLEREKIPFDPLQVVYLEDYVLTRDTRSEGKPVPPDLNAIDDLRVLINNKGEVLHCSRATTEPGAYYTMQMMNVYGSFKLELNTQFVNCWKLGHHQDNPSHPALIQTKEICGYVDTNQCGIRSGKPRYGIFGINQVGFYLNEEPSAVGRWSAGCLAGLHWSSHLEFIQRLRDSGRMFFSTVVISGSAYFDFNFKE